MTFDSASYIVFLAVVFLVYWRLHLREQNAFLLFASCVFYAWWDWRFLLLMAASTTLDFILARRIDAESRPRVRKGIVLASVAVNLSILGFFKYFNFFIDSFRHVADAAGLHFVPMLAWNIILPPAISFYTFQEIAYIVDVYEGRLRSASRFVDYGLFVSLFPHLIAGPIQKPSHLLPQIQSPRPWMASKAFDGMILILEGLFRKLVIADNCALIANAAFNGRFGTPDSAITLLGTYAFAWQIYGDFSGYSSIARGSAQLFGFHFMVNFRQPYMATSLQDFWRRWHISLSTFLRDYLYIRLGGNRLGPRRTYGNLLATMLLGGLWHGANWTFVIWGGIHGAALAIERKFLTADGDGQAFSFLQRWFRRIMIFHVVCLAWVFFRASSLAEASNFLTGILHPHWEPVYATAAAYLALSAAGLFFLDLELERSKSEYLLEGRRYATRVIVGVVLVAAISLLTAGSQSAFIYFQF